MLTRVNEKSRLPIEVTLLNSRQVATSPNTVHYRLDCETTGREILGWTEVTPAAAVINVLVTPAQNAILDRRNAYEIKSITVEANRGTDEAFTKVEKWRVSNILGVE